jgi:hypothetical protein
VTILRFDISKAVKIPVEVLWVVTPCSVAVGYLENGVSKVLLNVSILLQHYTALQPRRPRLGYDRPVIQILLTTFILFKQRTIYEPKYISANISLSICPKDKCTEFSYRYP